MKLALNYESRSMRQKREAEALPAGDEATARPANPVTLPAEPRPVIVPTSPVKRPAADVPLNYLLSQDEHENFEERAAIMEHDGELPREHAEAKALARVISVRDYAPGTLEHGIIELLGGVELNGDKLIPGKEEPAGAFWPGEDVPTIMDNVLRYNRRTA